MQSHVYFKKLYISGALLLFVILSGTIGYMIIDHELNFLDALYMTVITVGTVGAREAHELTPGGQIFTIYLIITGFGTFAYAISSVTSYILDGEFREYYRITRKLNAIEKLEGHVIICG